jgi:GTPase
MCIYKHLQDGNIEYKRQLLNCTANRLEKLKTQMSFRLDEGNGSCIYRIGVEDDGCHSLIDYDACAKTAKVLEYLARSLNAVVVERKMIQDEVMYSIIDGVAVRRVGDGKETDDDVVVVKEDSLLGDGKDQLYDDHHNHNHDYHHEKKDDDDEEESTDDLNEKKSTLDKTQGVYTRCELTVHRVETHLLDPSPMQNTNDQHSDGDKIRRANGNSSSPMSSSSKSKNAAADGENLSVGETLSSRNIRVAVVGNVDAGKSTMIGTLISSLLDDGRGSSRTSIMKHRHEIESGRTSTASTHLMGFRSTGEAIAGKDSIRANRRRSEDEVARESYRVVTLMDLAGHEKYLKTT